VSRARLTLIVAVGVACIAGPAAGLWLAFRGGGGHVDRTRYLAEVSSVCRVYARRLSRIGAPGDVSAYGDVIEAVSAVVPLLREQVSAMQAVPAPPDLRRGLGRLFAVDRSSVVALEATLAAARRRDAGGVAESLARFTSLRDRTHALAVAIGVDCTAG
jgi:hypothetical protein